MRSKHACLLFVVFLVAVPLLAGVPDQAFMKSGTVVVRTGTNYIAVGIAPTGGGQLDRLFIFWPSSPVSPSVKRYANARVEFEPGQLRVSQASEKSVQIYHVADKPAPAPFEGFSSATYAGIGLSHYVGGLARKFAISGKGARDPNVCYLDLGGCKDNAFKAFEPAR